VLKLIGQWLFRIAVFLVGAGAATFAIDWAAFRLQGSPQSVVTVNRMMVVPLKNNKQEYDYMGTFDEPCSISLFPQGNLTPCWWLRKHANQNVSI
jgi:hypothetical protein